MYPHDSGFAIYDRSAITALLINYLRVRMRVRMIHVGTRPGMRRRAAEAMDEVLGKELIESRELVAIP